MRRRARVIGHTLDSSQPPRRLVATGPIAPSGRSGDGGDVSVVEVDRLMQTSPES